MATIPYEALWVAGISVGIITALIALIWRITYNKACSADDKAEKALTRAEKSETAITEIKADLTYLRARVDEVFNKLLNGKRGE